MGLTRPSSGLSTPATTVPGAAAAAAAGGASWVTLTAAGADATLAEQGGVTWSDETGSEIRAAVDRSTSQSMNNINNNAGALVWDTGLLVSDNPTVTIQMTPSTAPGAGKDLFFVAMVVCASSTSPNIGTDKSVNASLLHGPNAAAGATVHQRITVNNGILGLDSDLASSQYSRLFVEIFEESMSGKFTLIRNGGANQHQSNITTTITGLTATDKVLIVVCAGCREVDTGTENVGMVVQYLASAGPV